MTDLVMCGIVWVLVAYSIYRGWRKATRIDRFAVLTWLVFVALALIFTFRCAVIERFIDSRFDDLPVTYWLNALSTLLAAVLYTISLRTVSEGPSRGGTRWFLWASPGMIGLLTFFLLAGFAGKVSRTQAYYAMKLALELFISTQLVLVLIPADLRMLRQEQVLPMRIKHMATITAFATYVTGAVTAVPVLLPALFSGQDDAGASLMPRVLIGLGCMVVMLVPHRWITLFLLPVHWYRYVKVASVERAIGERVPVQREPLRWRQAWRQASLEMAIYIGVINILDNYRRINPAEPQGRLISQQLEALLPLYPEYDDLVKAICRVTV